jgi:hypothetical protein
MIENKQQTALEWYDNEIEKLFNQFTIDKINIYEFRTKRFKLIEQAKEMEKEKAIKLYIDYENYLHEEFKHQNGGQAVILSFREFYEKTYGGNK